MFLNIAAKVFLSVFLLVAQAFAVTSEVEKFDSNLVRGEGPFPYNYRIIDGHIHAGGHPFNPKTSFGNSDKQILSILNYLKAKGVKTIIDLDNTSRIQLRYKRLYREVGLERFHLPLSSDSVPNAEEWEDLKEAMREPVYIHCTWGADRTGAVIAKYLVEEKGYSPKEAFEAVVTGGSHSGLFGGLKKISANNKLIKFFWPDYTFTPIRKSGFNESTKK